MIRKDTPASALLAAALLATLVAAGCSQQPAPSVAPQPTSTAATAGAGATGSPATATPAPAEKPADLAHLSLGLEKRWSGFRSPLFLTNAGDGSGRLFVLEQGGRVRVIENGAVQKDPYLDLSSKVSSGGERGLLGIAFSPDFRRDGKVYVDYTDMNGDTVIARYVTSDPASSKPTWQSPTMLLHIAQPYPNHNGGCILFGPDGYLYIGMGDGGSAGDPGNRAQTPWILLGKLLRIDVSRTENGKPYAIPATNPARTSIGTSKLAPEVWATGMRNPWRFYFDSDGSLWVADVGQDAWEEIDNVSAARQRAAEKSGVALNFGWHLYEGTHQYPSGTDVAPRARTRLFVWPIAEYPHPDGESITGGYVYRGSAYPALRGTYVYGDFVKGWVGALRTTDAAGKPLASPDNRPNLLQTNGQPSSFGRDEHGELYLVDYRGAIYRVTGSAK